MIPYGRQDIKPQDVEAVIDVLKSDFLTQGPMVPRFEKTVADKVGAEYALAVNSATSALHIACLALGLKHSDWLWTTPITFVASANCGRYCGAQVDFVDIDPDTYNLCPKALEAKLIRAEELGKLPKIVVPVHLCGQPCDMQEIHALSKRYGFHIIEDASHAIGGKYQGEYVGNGRYSDVTIFSFHPVKIVTTAEGGMAVTNNKALADKMDLFRSHGITRDPDLMTKQADGPWYYQQVALGYNYRMTELQAALGVSQMERLDEYVAKRNALAGRYDDILAHLPITLPKQHPDSYSGRHLYVICLNLDALHISHASVFEQLRKMGIGVNLHYIPVTEQPDYLQLGVEYDALENAHQYYAEAISIPLYPTMTHDEQDAVASALERSLYT